MMATYRQLLESLNLSEQNPKEHKPGDIWQTASGNWYGMRKDKDTGKPESQSYGHETNSKDKAQLYAKGGDPSTLDTKDDEEEPKPEGPAPKKLNPQELKDKQADDALIKQNSKIMDFEERITDLQARAEWDLEGKEEKKQREALITSLESLRDAPIPKEQKDRIAGEMNVVPSQVEIGQPTQSPIHKGGKRKTKKNRKRKTNKKLNKLSNNSSNKKRIKKKKSLKH